VQLPPNILVLKPLNRGRHRNQILSQAQIHQRLTNPVKAVDPPKLSVQNIKRLTNRIAQVSNTHLKTIVDKAPAPKIIYSPYEDLPSPPSRNEDSFARLNSTYGKTACTWTHLNRTITPIDKYKFLNLTS